MNIPIKVTFKQSVPNSSELLYSVEFAPSFIFEELVVIFCTERSALIDLSKEAIFNHIKWRLNADRLDFKMCKGIFQLIDLVEDKCRLEALNEGRMLVGTAKPLGMIKYLKEEL